MIKNLNYERELLKMVLTNIKDDKKALLPCFFLFFIRDVAKQNNSVANGK